MHPLFHGNEKNPFHISVGAVVVNTEGQILAHKMVKDKITPEYQHKIGGLTEAYILMRETMENGESLEQAVTRGLEEEFGVTGVIERYIGSLQFEIEGFEKTTLFFLVRLAEQGVRPPEDDEAHTELVWTEPEFLLERMRAQGQKSNRTDLDESKIVETYINYAKS